MWTSREKSFLQMQWSGEIAMNLRPVIQEIVHLVIKRVYDPANVEKQKH